jgi:hypothetical protein
MLPVDDLLAIRGFVWNLLNPCSFIGTCCIIEIGMFSTTFEPKATLKR